MEWRSRENEIGCLIEAESPWWVTDDQRPALVGHLALRLRGVVGSRVDLVRRALDTEELTASRDEPLLWSFGPHGTLFGNAPIEDASAFLIELADWLLVQQAPLDLWEYFGFASFADLATRISHSSYHLLSGPLPILRAASQMLAAREIPFLLKPSDRPSVEALVAVWVGQSWVVCEDATVALSAQAG